MTRVPRLLLIRSVFVGVYPWQSIVNRVRPCLSVAVCNGVHPWRNVPSASESAVAQAEHSSSTLTQSKAQHEQAANAVTTLEPLINQRGARASAIETARYNLNNCRVYAPFNARVTNLLISEGAYAHVGHAFGAWTPYVRYEFASLDQADDYFALMASGQSYRRGLFGLRFDIDPRSTVKLRLSTASTADENRFDSPTISTTDSPVPGDWAASGDAAVTTRSAARSAVRSEARGSTCAERALRRA